MKYFVIMVGLVVAGCSINRTEVVTTIHPETQHHIIENTEHFTKLVNVIRLNSNVKKPSNSLKNEIKDLANKAGLVPTCNDKYGCYLTKSGFDGRITIDKEYVIIDFVGKSIKVEDINEAINIIYS